MYSFAYPKTSRFSAKRLSDFLVALCRRGAKEWLCLFLACFYFSVPCARADSRVGEATDIKWLLTQAVAFEHGEGVEKDARKAIALYCDAARQGDAESQYRLGWMYANARGVDRNDAHASFLFRAAADQGHTQAFQMIRHVGEPSAAGPECLRLPPDPTAVATDEEPHMRRAVAGPKHIVDLVNRLAPEYKVQPLLALAVIQAESNFDTKAVSAKNAQGLMQLIPETAKRFNVIKPLDPEQNIRGGLSYLRWLLSYFRGQIPLVLAGYNAGEGAVDRYRGVPPYSETRGYVKRIMAVYGRENHPFVEDVTKQFSGTRYR